MAEVWTPPTFDDIATTDLVPAAYLNQLGNSLRFLKEVAYVQFTSDVNATATTVGTANQIVSAGAITYENVPHVIEFFCPMVDLDTQTCFVIIRDSTTVLGTLAQLASATNFQPLHAAVRITPTAAAHTYNIAAWNTGASTTVFNAGTGGTAGDQTTHLAGFIRVTRIPT
jgi:hypothetical protein